MRKAKFKNRIWKTGFLLIGILLTFTSCEKDESFDNSKEVVTIENNSNYTVPNRTTAKDSFQKTNNFENLLKSSNISAKGKKNESFIDWNNSKIVKFKQKENLNILYSPIIYDKNGKKNKSFVASINNNAGKTESFIFSLFYAKHSTNENFSGDVIKFNTNGEALELYNYENGVLKTTYTFKQDKDKKKNNVSSKYIDLDCGITWEDIMFMYEYGGGTLLNCVEIIGSSSSGGTSSGSSWSNPDTNLSGGSIPLGNNYTTGGSSGSTSGVTSNPANINSLWFAEEDINISTVTNYLISNLSLNVVQRSWVNNSNNAQNVLNLYNFLKLNPNSIEDENFAKEAININIGLDSFDKLSNSPDFDPLNNPWLKQIRDYAERVFKLKDKLSDKLWENLNRRIDALFISALTKTALEINPEADTQKESNKDYEFKTNGKNGVGILLYEFANGEGPAKRDFYFSEHDFAKQFLSGDVPNNIKTDFFNVLDIKGLTFEQFVTQGNAINGGYSFSPDHTSVSDSFNKHINANWVQFFIGGTKAEYRPSTESGWIEVKLENPTSRNSLLLHQAESYPRDTYGNIPLSTIKQYFHFKLKIQ